MHIQQSSRGDKPGNIIRVLCLSAGLLAMVQINATVMHDYDVGKSGNSNTLWKDAAGQLDLSSATGSDGKTYVVFANDPRVSISRAYRALNANLNAGSGSGLSNKSYTLEFWVKFADSFQPGEVIFETGGEYNGFSLYTRDGGLELASFSSTTGLDLLATVSLKDLDLTHYIQIVVIYDPTSRLISLRAKDVNGIEISDAKMSDKPLSTGTANGMSLFAGGNGAFQNNLGSIGGANATGASLTNPRVFSGSMGLFRILNGIDLDATSLNYSRIVIPADRSSDPRPNIIVVLTDDHGYADVAAQNEDKDVLTPNIDTLARGGIRFTHGYVTAPQCVPSRAGLLSGRYQQHFGVTENGKGPMPLSVVTIAERLRTAGYRTGMTGKWHLDPNKTDKQWAAENNVDPDNIPDNLKKRYYPGQQGFEEYAYGNTSHYYLNFNRNGSDNVPFGTGVSESGHRIDIQSDFAVSFIKRNHNRPFFLYLAYFAPHVPLTWVDRYRNTFNSSLPEKRRIALGMIKAMDDGIGRIMSSLTDYHIDKNTVIWFIGDNGAPLGFQEAGNVGATDASTHWDGSLNTPWLGEKGMLAEGGIRVPWIMWWKGTITPMTYDPSVISLDVAATANALAGLPADPALEGVNLIPYLKGNVTGAPHKNLYWSFWNQSTIIQGNWKYINLAKGTGEFLFNLDSDKQERANLAGEYPDKAALLKNDLDQWLSQFSTQVQPGNNPNPQETVLYKHNFGFGDDNFDSDGDGVTNQYDAFPDNPAENSDFDKDGIGDNADTDDDNDQLPDDYEINHGLNPKNPDDAQGDLDNDGLSNLLEYIFKTNPGKPDTDGDGVSDGKEVSMNRNPLVNENTVLILINN